MRTLEEINLEYSKLCGELGHAVHHTENELKILMAKLEKDAADKIQDLKNKISALKLEGADVQKAMTLTQEAVKEEVKSI